MRPPLSNLVLCLSIFICTVQAQTPIWVNDTHLVFSGTENAPGIGWSCPGVDPSDRCGADGIGCTTNLGSYVSLFFSGTAVTVNLMADVFGATLDVYIDEQLLQSVATKNQTSFYDCNYVPVTAPNLVNKLHNVTLVDTYVPNMDFANLYLYNFVITGTVASAPPAATTSASPTSSTASSTSSSPSSSGSSTNDTAPAHRSSSGAAIGGAVGGVIVLALVGFLGFFLIRRRRQRQARDDNLDLFEQQPDPWKLPEAAVREQDFVPQRPMSAAGVTTPLLLGGPEAASSSTNFNPYSSPTLTSSDTRPASSMILESTPSAGSKNRPTAALPPGAASPAPPTSPPPPPDLQTPNPVPAAPASQLGIIQRLVDQGVDRATIRHVISIMSAAQQAGEEPPPDYYESILRNLNGPPR